MPDSLTPPNGAISVETIPVFNPTMPYSSCSETLQLFAKLDQNMTIGPNWRPRPTTDLFPLSRHLGEFVCREFAREGKINISIIRLGDTIDEDTTGAFQQAIDSDERWKITHL